MVSKGKLPAPKLRTVTAPRKISVERAGVECNIPLFLDENSARMVEHVKTQVTHHKTMLKFFEEELRILEQLEVATKEYSTLERDRKAFLRGA